MNMRLLAVASQCVVGVLIAVIGVSWSMNNAEAATFQSQWRVKPDLYGQTSQSWSNVINTNISLGPSQGFRIRFHFYESATSAATITPYLEYKLASGGACSDASGWTKVTGSTTNAFSLYDSTTFAEPVNTTEQLTSQSGISFSAGKMYDQTNPGVGIVLSKNETEYEWAIRTTTGATVDTAYIMRVSNNGTGFGTYSVCPQITVTAWQGTLVDSGPRAAKVFAGDINGDGSLDLAATLYSSGAIAWYQNNNDSPVTFTKRIVENYNAAIGPYSIWIGDLNNDGLADIASGDTFAHTFSWYKNNGGSPVTFTKNTIAASGTDNSEVFGADINGDGYMDLVTADSVLNQTLWYKSDGATTPTFTKNVVRSSVTLAYGTYAADINGDGKMDIMTCGDTSNLLAWEQNSGGSSPTWTSRNIDTAANGCTTAWVTDIDLDGDQDVVAALDSSNAIYWYENSGANPPTWTKRAVDTAYTAFFQAAIGDINGDGFPDIVSASNGNDAISWYENSGASPPTWTKRVVSLGHLSFAPQSVITGDVNGDGTVDIIDSAGSNVANKGWTSVAWYNWVSNTVKLWKNTASGNCSTGSNWQGGSAPTTSSFVQYSGTGTNASTWDSGCPASIKGLSLSRQISSGYTGTVTIDRRLQIGGNLSVQKGTLLIKNNVTVSGSVVLMSGASIRIAPGGSLTVGNGFGKLLTHSTITNSGTLVLGGQGGTKNAPHSFERNVVYGTITNYNGSTITLTGLKKDRTILIPNIGGNYNSLTTSTGSTFAQTAALTVNGNLTIAQGTLSGGSAINLSGSWLKNTGASYLGGASTVTLTGGNQTVSGSTTFWNLTKTVTSAATLTFASTAQQIVSNALTLRGAVSNLLSIRSSMTNLAAKLRLTTGGTQTIDYLDVQDNDASGGETLTCLTASEGCVQGTNTTNWNFGSASTPKHWGTLWLPGFGF